MERSQQKRQRPLRQDTVEPIERQVGQGVEVGLDVRGENPLIKAKKVVLKNDYIRQMIDVYHL